METNIKTVADFKRSLKVGQTKLHTTYHKAFGGRDESGKVIYKDEDKGIRVVSIAQSNSFALATPKKEDASILVDSWCDYPKASQVVFNSPKSVTILERDYRIRDKEEKDLPLIPILTYTFVD